MNNRFFSGKLLAAALIYSMPLSLPGQTTSDGSMPQYYFENFSQGEVRMKNGQIQTPSLNYNTVTEKMVFMRNDKYYDISNPEMVDTVIIQDIKFVPEGKVFYEVLISGSPSLFVQFKGELLPAGKPVGYGGTSQLASTVYLSSVDLSSGRYNLPLPSDFIVKITPVYWIRKDNEWFNFMNDKQFLKLFPEKSGELKDFIRKNRIKIDNKEDIIKLVNYCYKLD